MDSDRSHRVSRLKVTYQRNLLMGTLVASGVISMAALFVHLTKDETVLFNTAEIIFTDIDLPGNSGGYPAGQERRGSVSGLSFKNRLGSPISSSIISTQSGHEPAENLGFYFEENGSDIKPSSYPIGDWWPVSISSDEWPIKDDPIEFIKNKPIRILDYNNDISQKRKRDRPLLLQLKKPRYPAGLYVDVDATVTLGMTLNNKGYIIGWEVYYEEPPGKGFARALKKALRNSYIKVEIRNGQKVGGHYIITYEFCKKCPDRPVVIKSPDNVIVTF